MTNEHKVSRDAGTGKYISREDALEDPDGTVTETVVASSGEQQASVGRVVHYVSYGTPGGEYQSQCRAAIVTQTQQDDRLHVSIAVLNPSGMFFDQYVPYDEDKKAGGSWHWPERV